MTRFASERLFSSNCEGAAWPPAAAACSHVAMGVLSIAPGAPRRANRLVTASLYPLRRGGTVSPPPARYLVPCFACKVDNCIDEGRMNACFACKVDKFIDEGRMNACFASKVDKFVHEARRGGSRSAARWRA